MSNNTMNLRGFLICQTIGYLDGLMTASGWIYTDRASMGGRHPFVVSGRPAEVIAAYAREYGLTPIQDPPDFPEHAAGVVVRGKLLSYGMNAYVSIRSVHFFPASLDAQNFCINDLTLGGQIIPGNHSLVKQNHGDREVTMLDAYLATDSPANGGLHPILFIYELAEEVIHKFQQTDFEPFKATIVGHLLTTHIGSIVYIKVISFETTPVRPA